jgi:cytochrome c biogenesis protein CcmG/thiol:disulfide interchange protein DsbE
MESAGDAPVIKPGTFSLRGRIIPAIALTLVVALLALLAWAIFGSHDPAVQQNGRINTTGYLVPFKGKQAPTFSATDMSGKQVSLEDYRGKTVILNFWASWCPPCRDEAPVFSRLSSDLASQDVVVLGVAVWDQASDSKSFMQEFGLTYPNVSDDNGSIAIDYGVAGVPETFFIGPKGELLGKYPGPLTSVEQVKSIIQDIRGG